MDDKPLFTTCPSCAESISDGSVVCPRCDTPLAQHAAQDASKPASARTFESSVPNDNRLHESSSNGMPRMAIMLCAAAVIGLAIFVLPFASRQSGNEEYAAQNTMTKRDAAHAPATAINRTSTDSLVISLSDHTIVWPGTQGVAITFDCAETTNKLTWMSPESGKEVSAQPRPNSTFLLVHYSVANNGTTTFHDKAPDFKVYTDDKLSYASSSDISNWASYGRGDLGASLQTEVVPKMPEKFVVGFEVPKSALSEHPLLSMCFDPISYFDPNLTVPLWTNKNENSVVLAQHMNRVAKTDAAPAVYQVHTVDPSVHKN